MFQYFWSFLGWIRWTLDNILRTCLKVQYFQEYDNAGASPLSLKWISLLPKSRTQRQAAFSDRQADTINEIVKRLKNLEASHRSHLARLNKLLTSLNSLQSCTSVATTSTTSTTATSSATTSASTSVTTSASPSVTTPAG